jgi:hypothetical protein
VLKQGSTYEGPLSVKEGGIRLFDPVRVGVNKFSDERYARLVISSAQLLAAVGGTTLFQLAPAPGTNKFYEFLTGWLVMKHGGTAYTGLGNVAIHAGTAVGDGAFLSGNVPLNSFDSATSDIVQSIPQLTTTFTAATNRPLNLQWRSGAPVASLTGGNGQLIVIVSYRIQDLAL